MTDLQAAVAAVGTVYTVRESPENLELLGGIASNLGYRLKPLNSLEEAFLGASIERPGCLVVDFRAAEGLHFGVHQPGGLGPNPLPVIVTSDQADLPVAVRLLIRDGVDLLEKPYQPSQLRSAIERAVLRDDTQCRVYRRFDSISAAVDRLSSRETEVLRSIVAGQLNKSIAKNLGVSVRTVEGDRARIVEKFSAETTGEVVGKYAEYRLLTDLGYQASAPHAATA